LFFSDDFNQPVDNLPLSLTHLTFGFNFNQSVDKLPLSLTHLYFGCWFNQPVDNLPTNLTYLFFSDDFNQPVDNLPLSLTHLTFGFNFNQSVDNLPENIIVLKLFGSKNNNIIIPKNVKELYIYNDNILINNLPEHIEKLFILFNYFSKTKIENLPITLKEIIVEKNKYIKYIKIPFETKIIVDDELFIYY
jgi:hypothetical protein